MHSLLPSSDDCPRLSNRTVRIARIAQRSANANIYYQNSRLQQQGPGSSHGDSRRFVCVCGGEGGRVFCLCVVGHTKHLFMPGFGRIASKHTWKKRWRSCRADGRWLNGGDWRRREARRCCAFVANAFAFIERDASTLGWARKWRGGRCCGIVKLIQCVRLLMVLEWNAEQFVYDISFNILMTTNKQVCVCWVYAQPETYSFHSEKSH